MKLTKNERSLLIYLLEKGRMSDTEIARNLKITTQAAGKIRKKLEKQKVIKGYRAILSFSQLGIKVFAVCMLKTSPLAFEKFKEVTEKNRANYEANIMSMYRIPRGDVTHIAVFGFRNLNELDNYFHIMQKKFSRYFEIRRIYIFSDESLIKQGTAGLFKKILEEWDNQKQPAPKPQDFI